MPSVTLAPNQSPLHFLLAAKIGEGALGRVYRATDARLGRDIAIRVLRAELSEDICSASIILHP